MSARPLLQMTPAAPWAYRIALLPIPLLIVAVALSRFSLIDLPSFFVVVALAWVLAALAVVAAGMAFRAIWLDGRYGFGRALAGALIGLVVLGMPALAVVEMIRLPRLADIATDPSDPPPLALAPDRQPPDAADAAAQLAAYPDIVPRHYPVSPERTFTEVENLIAERGWRVVQRDPPSPDNGLGVIGAEAKSFGFAWPVDVAVRLEADEEGTLVDMRSASRIGAHDLGDDARRIRSFFADLDTALQGVVETDDGADTEPLPPLPPQPPR